MTTSLAPEIVWFEPSEAYSRNPISTLDAMNKTSKSRGLLALRYGFEEQSPSRGVWLMVWKNLEEQHSFMRCESYIDFAIPVMEAMVGRGEITQVLLSQHQDFFWAIASPVTQFIYITLRPQHDRNSELTPLIEELARELTSVSGCYGSSWGPSVQQDNIYVGIVGWRDIADWDRAAMGSLSRITTLIKAISSIHTKSVQLSAA